ncbi:hypothetical protein V5T82_15370 [Magnetovibrio sp. PR-2]|uniref:hypothetical protein n=1 Tax=Magnetovibrio sp. PR-2 TaxID=3120356 RepID=UPI002FCE1131
MSELKNLIRKANSFLEMHPVPWDVHNNELKTIAMALLVDRGLTNDVKDHSDRHGILHLAISRDRVENTLAQVHSWWRYTPDKADTVAKGIGSTLRKCGYKDRSASTQRVVGAYEIETKKEAAVIATALEVLSTKKQCNTGLFKGLLSCLCLWNKAQAYGAATPEDLKQLRKDKDLTQQQAAKILKITHRQYCRHEAGESPISEERYKTLKDVSRFHILKG